MAYSNLTVFHLKNVVGAEHVFEFFWSRGSYIIWNMDIQEYEDFDLKRNRVFINSCIVGMEIKIIYHSAPVPDFLVGIVIINTKLLDKTLVYGLCSLFSTGTFVISCYTIINYHHRAMSRNVHFLSPWKFLQFH